MFFQRIDLKQFMLVSLAAHAVVAAMLTIFHLSQDRVVIVPMSFGNDPTKAAGGGQGAARGRFISFPQAPRPNVTTSKPTISRPVIKTVSTNTIPTQQSAVVAQPSSNSAIGTGDSSSTGTGTGVGTGSGDGIGSGNGGGINSARAKYFTDIAKLIERNKKYPPLAKRMGHHGLVTIKLTLDKTGKILGVEVLEGVKFNTLREASIKAIESVSHFPGIPEEFGVEKISFNVPIKYQLE